MDGDNGREFKGIAVGRYYDRFASLFGFGKPLYRRAVAGPHIDAGAVVLGLGCGTASLGLATAERAGREVELHGLDFSSSQMEHAGRKDRDAGVSFHTHRCFMDRLPFQDGPFEAVVTRLALHMPPPGSPQGHRGGRPGAQGGRDLHPHGLE
ncbi:MAG: class I SAM-dependent methyltransferase [Actinomycetota bacterium]|nr:class I SAM-dependent methyltransferase [Actinomycetota bacterium]